MPAAVYITSFFLQNVLKLPLVVLCSVCVPTVSLVHIVTQWSGSDGTEAYLSGQLASFSALTLLVGSSGL